jgi:hypothetical protein
MLFVPRLSGRFGAAMTAILDVPASAITWILTEWEYEEVVDNVEARACGDFWTERIPLFRDYIVQIKGYMSSAEPYVNAGLPVGATTLLDLRLTATSANPFIALGGLCTRGRIFTPHNGPVTLEATIVSIDGSTGPSIDQTPST